MGTTKMRNKKLSGQSAYVMGDVKKKYRVIIQERKTKTNNKERMKCFTLYDYTGKSNIDEVKKKLLERGLSFRKKNGETKKSNR